MQDILTEKEAQTRRCPYSFGAPRFIMGNSGTITKAEPEYATVDLFPPNCIASECMAWRLAHKDAADGTERGYCGAFGLPRFT